MVNPSSCRINSESRLRRLSTRARTYDSLIGMSECSRNVLRQERNIFQRPQRRAYLRKLQKAKTWRLRRDDAPAEWSGYNERKRDRHALRCSHGTPPSPSLWRTRLLTCSYLPHAARALLRFCTGIFNYSWVHIQKLVLLDLINSQYIFIIRRKEVQPSTPLVVGCTFSLRFFVQTNNH